MAPAATVQLHTVLVPHHLLQLAGIAVLALTCAVFHLKLWSVTKPPLDGQYSVPTPQRASTSQVPYVGYAFASGQLARTQEPFTGEPARRQQLDGPDVGVAALGYEGVGVAGINSRGCWASSDGISVNAAAVMQAISKW